MVTRYPAIAPEAIGEPGRVPVGGRPGYRPRPRPARLVVPDGQPTPDGRATPGSDTPAGRDRTHRRRARGGRGVTVAAFVLVISGLLVGATTGWDWWSRVTEIRANQVRLAQAFDTGRPAAGTLARLHVPRLHLAFVVVDGDDPAALLRGPGHVPNTAAFGEPGNVGVAGHRYPGMFWDLDRLRVGDPVVVETADRWLVYRVRRELVVGPEDAEVLAPRPVGAPAGADQFLTLVTCDPVFTTLRRLVRQAVLVRASPRAAGPPIELGNRLR